MSSVAAAADTPEEFAALADEVVEDFMSDATSNEVFSTAEGHAEVSAYEILLFMEPHVQGHRVTEGATAVASELHRVRARRAKTSVTAYAVAAHRNGLMMSSKAHASGILMTVKTATTRMASSRSHPLDPPCV